MPGTSSRRSSPAPGGRWSAITAEPQGIRGPTVGPGGSRQEGFAMRPDPVVEGPRPVTGDALDAVGEQGWGVDGCGVTVEQDLQDVLGHRVPTRGERRGPAELVDVDIAPDCAADGGDRVPDPQYGR